jgi:PAS domain S-box-containing protein
MPAHGTACLKDQKANRMTRYLRFSFISALVIGVAFLGFLANQARIEIRLFQEEPLDNIYWNLTQLELDLVRFQSAVELSLALSDYPKDELLKRFDLFYSRINNFSSSSTLARFDLTQTVAPAITRLRSFLEETTPVIDGDPDRLVQSLPNLATELESLRKDLRVTIVQVIDINATKADSRRAGLSSLISEVAAGTLALFFLLTILLGSVLYLNRRAERDRQAAVRASARLKATVETALDAVIVAGMDGNVIDFNRSAEQIFGYRAEEAIGRRLEDLIVPARHIAGHAAGMKRMAMTGEKRVVDKGRIQITARRKNGEEFPIELSISSSEGPDGTIFIAYLRDISRRLANERAMLAARDEALAAGQAKTNFMAVMSHEMRTPLNGVMAALETLSRDAAGARQEKFIGLAKASAGQLMRHINDVLDLTKVSSGHLTLRDETFDLAQLASGFVETLQPLADKSGTRLLLSAPPRLPRVQGDSFRIGQIVQNLLSNAIKFTPNGTVQIKIDVRDQSAGVIHVELRVIDNGIGIAPADLDHVFDDFVMLDSSYARATSGTGLGLTISRRLAEAMGGSIGVESKEGEGSCFWVRLPLRVTTGGPDPVSAKRSAGAAPHPTAVGELDVLVVEDNETNRSVLEEMLSCLNHRVTLAPDGAVGVELARNHRYDVILMDISMPVMDGLTAVGLIRAEGASANARIVAVTAHAMPQELDRFRAAGMDDCLLKPISEAALVQALSAGPVQAATTPDPGLVNEARIEELRAAMGDAGMTRVLTSFRSATAEVIDRIARFNQDGQPADLMALCHEAAGSSAMVGATGLHALLAEMEDLCRQGNLAAALSRADSLSALWADTEALLSNRAA